MSEADRAGKRLGAYAIERELGRGGMGTVMLGRDTALDRPVALKLLPAELARNKEYVERFVREARTAAKINHPNVVQIYGAGFEQETAFIAMELVPGGNLKDLVADLRPFPIGLALDVVRQAALGLAKAHAQGIIHRDLKPENVLLTPEGQVKLADFGLAFQAQGERITVSGTYLGTPQYSSPEQCNGDPIDAPSDLYSLGVILFELLSGKPPYEAPTPLALFHRILTQPIPSLAELRPELPKSLVAVVERLLQKDPTQRYQSAGELAGDLDRIAAGLPDAGPRPKLGDSTPGAAFLVRPTDPTRIETPLPASAAETVVAAVTPRPETPLPAELAALSLGGGGGGGEPQVGRMVGRLGAVGAVLVLALIAMLAWSTVVTPTRPGDVALIPVKPGEGGAPEDWSWLSGAVVDFLEAELSNGRRVSVYPEGYTGSPLAFLQSEHAHFTVGGTYYKQGPMVAVKLAVKDAKGELVFSELLTCSQESILTELARFAAGIRERLDVQARVPVERGDHQAGMIAQAPKAMDAASEERRERQLSAADNVSSAGVSLPAEPPSAMPMGQDEDAPAPAAVDDEASDVGDVGDVGGKKDAESKRRTHVERFDPVGGRADKLSSELADGVLHDRNESDSDREPAEDPAPRPEAAADMPAPPPATHTPGQQAKVETQQVPVEADQPSKQVVDPEVARLLQQLRDAETCGNEWQLHQALRQAARCEAREVHDLARQVIERQAPSKRRVLGRILERLR